jgi:hypothetical protein
MGAATQEANETIKKARGRKDSEGQEAVIREKPLKDALAELQTLHEKSDAAHDKLNDAIKAVAEKSGMQSKVIRKAVFAKHADEIEEVEREVEQLQIALDVVKQG